VIEMAAASCKGTEFAAIVTLAKNSGFPFSSARRRSASRRDAD
jgi:hypothetical protein